MRAAVARRIRKRIPIVPASLNQSPAAPARFTPRITGPRTASSATGWEAPSALTCGTSRNIIGSTPVRDVGLIASEGRMTIPMADGTASGVLDVTTHFFEFIPEEEGDKPNPTVLLAHELKEGRTYYILLTTAYGLYRYNIFDVVRCTGFFNQTPLVEFLEQGLPTSPTSPAKRSPNITSPARWPSATALNLNLTAYSVAPCWDDEMPFYGLFIDAPDLASREQGIKLTQTLEQRLAEINSEYASKTRNATARPDAAVSAPRPQLARLGSPAPGPHRRHARAIQASLPHPRPEIPARACKLRKKCRCSHRSRRAKNMAARGGRRGPGAFRAKMRTMLGPHFVLRSDPPRSQASQLLSPLRLSDRPLARLVVRLRAKPAVRPNDQRFCPIGHQFLGLTARAAICDDPAAGADLSGGDHCRGARERHAGAFVSDRFERPGDSLGKFAARVVHLIFFMLMSLPMLAIISLWGGINVEFLLVHCGISLLLILLVSSMCLWTSVATLRYTEAMMLSYALQVPLGYRGPL